MKILKIVLFFAAIAFVLGSCSKQVDLKPTDSLTPLNAFRTINDAQLGANEAYNRFILYYHTMYQSALVSDEAKLGKDNSGQGALTYRFQYSSDNTSGGDVITSFYDYYFIIDQVNRVLAALPNVIAANPTEEARRNIIKGQLLALRGIAHFYVMQSYCKAYDPADPKGIAYMKESNPNAQPARLSVGTAMNMIETDLNDGFNLLPAVTVASFTDTVMNQINITGYKAKIALYKRDYLNAITYSSTVITSAVRPLATPATYGSIWTDANVLLETLFRTRTGTRTDVGSVFTTTGNLIYIAPSNKLINSFGTGDVRKAAAIGGTGPDAYYINKFYTSSRGGRAVDIKEMRIAEMYLIRAEAYAKQATPNIALGAADLNTLRAARITPYTNATFATAGDLVSAIIDERFKEFCFEGFRNIDLKRNNLPVQRDITDVQSAAWQNLPAGNFRFVLPIPQDQLLSNPNYNQNDGY